MRGGSTNNQGMRYVNVRLGRAACLAEPLEERLLMAAALRRGGSGYSGTLASDPTLRQQQLICDPPEPVQGQTSVLYDANKVTLRAANGGPGYANGDFHGFIEVLLSGVRRLEDLDTYFNTDEPDRPPETGYAQIYFKLAGQAGQISINPGYTMMDDGGQNGVDTHQLMFQLKQGVPDDAVVSYTILSAPSNMRSGNAADYLAYQADDGSAVRLEYPSLTPATVSTASALTYLRSSKWTPAFLNNLSAGGMGDSTFGYRLIPRGEFPEATWSNVDQITFNFDEALPTSYGLSADRVRIIDTASGKTYAVQSASYNASLRRALVQLVSPLPAGKFRVALDLDADNAPEREAVFAVVPGDDDRNDVVNAIDYVAARNSVGRSVQNPGTGTTAYNPFTDINGDGIINASDLVLVRNHIGATSQQLRAGVFAPPTSSLFADRRVRNDSDDGKTLLD